VIWARQAIDALLELKQASDAARAAGHRAIDAEVLESTAAGSATVLALNAARRSKLQRKRHAWRPGCATAGTTTCASPMTCGFLRQHEAQQIIRMSKLRIKVSGCMRSMTGIEAFCAIRFYLATATRHGIPWLDGLTPAAQGNPWIRRLGTVRHPEEESVAMKTPRRGQV
jgi:transposase